MTAQSTSTALRLVNGAGEAEPTPQDEPVLAVRGLGLVRGRREVLRSVDLSVSAAEVIAIVGANGAGKTTLLECLAGVLRATSGEVSVCGRTSIRSSSARRLIGWLGHETALYGELTARENLLFAARMYDVPQAADRVAALLAAVGLEGKAHQPVQRFSLGMRRRLALARAVIHDPPLLLLDEPFANLDAGYRCWLKSLLLELRQQGRATCLTSHDPDYCRAFVDRILCLENGCLRTAKCGAQYAVVSYAREA
jgi:heme ABC exporter ATP-binding subunit CcmA